MAKELTDKQKALALIKELHGIRVIPKTFLTELETYIEGEYDYIDDEYVNAYDWNVVYYSYRQSKKNIEWSRQNKNFRSNLNMLRYTLAIAKEWMPKVDAKIKALAKIAERDKDIEYKPIETNRFSKSRSKVNISRFLGDD